MAVPRALPSGMAATAPAGAPGLSAAGAAVVGALAFGVWRQGAYHPADFVVFAAAVLVATAAALAAPRPAPVPRTVVAPLGLLAVWALVRGAAGGRPGSAVAMAAVVVAVVGALLVAGRAGRVERAWLARGLLGVGALVAATAWAGVAWRHWPWAIPGQQVWRGSSTLTYANAAAGLLAPLAAVALGRVVARPTAVGRRLTAVVLLVGAGSTLSRGGALSLAVAGAVLAGVLGPGRVARAVAPAVAGAVVALAGLAPSFPGDAPPRPALAAAALALGLVVAAGRRRAVAAVLVVVGTAGLVAAGGAVGDAGRLTPASPDRVDELAATTRVVAAHPLTGVGPGRFALAWEDGPGRWVRARHAHNEYAQVAAVLGIPALLVLLAAFGATARALRSAVRAGPDRGLVAGCAAGLAGLAAHSAVDFLWHVPVIPVVAGMLAGLALAGGHDHEGGHA